MLHYILSSLRTSLLQKKLEAILFHFISINNLPLHCRLLTLQLSEKCNKTLDNISDDYLTELTQLHHKPPVATMQPSQ